uniref:Reverse transcriptase domain-containing protein n=1 Tax=Arundo donax TaxID=35708 RepID=A0A0A9B3W4_ARUDO
MLILPFFIYMPVIGSERILLERHKWMIIFILIMMTSIKQWILFFEDLIGNAGSRERSINLDMLQLQPQDLSDLDNPFMEVEVWQTIKDLPPDKAPGPDGFTGRFYRSCWHIIKGDLMMALTALYNGDQRMLGMLNSAYLTLIPKKPDAIRVGDYRPISLVHSFAKLITKILANPLAPKLNELVSTNQSAFIQRRCIQDNFFLVQQTARFLHHQKDPRILLKLDISKAFDSVQWPFLLEVLSHLGFGDRWRNILCGLLFTASTQVMVNGVPRVSISHQRGLRQGDPLSPMLFIIVMDCLNALISRASSEGLLQPLARRALPHRMSLYVDDVVLFVRPLASDLIMIKEILELFGDATGLRTNIQKCSFSPIQCTNAEISTVKEEFHCEKQDFPLNYLGLPLSLRKLTMGQLQHILDKLADKLPGWKAALMHPAGRLILVRAVLTAISIHLLIALDVPKGLIKAIDKIRRAFLWKGKKEVNGGHCAVAWSKDCRPLELGGLGIHNLELLSWSLRMRWLWLQQTQPDKPWAGFKFQVHNNVKALFLAAVTTNVGSGMNTLF